ncbi:uncharacterized protein LOC128089016 [Tympanuchus pallidicinctus]|uniref:uncharacterized protein LOC128089016 n=1 Tax=Tympanuchus pallidicinctus TaxID=109042 RepID=UPI002286DDE6|nr:uncharacterized protein LOC128089016 [Tympanuchus pallidicinctus]
MGPQTPCVQLPPNGGSRAPGPALGSRRGRTRWQPVPPPSSGAFSSSPPGRAGRGAQLPGIRRRVPTPRGAAKSGPASSAQTGGGPGERADGRTDTRSPARPHLGLSAAPARGPDPPGAAPLPWHRGVPLAAPQPRTRGASCRAMAAPDVTRSGGAAALRVCVSPLPPPTPPRFRGGTGAVPPPLAAPPGTARHARARSFPSPLSIPRTRGFGSVRPRVLASPVTLPAPQHPPPSVTPRRGRRHPHPTRTPP